MLEDVGISSEECRKLEIIFLIFAVFCPFFYFLVRKFVPNFIPSGRKISILGLTTIIIATHLLIGAVLLKKTENGFEMTFRLSLSLKCLAFLNISAFSTGPFFIFSIYSDAIAPQCSNRMNPYFMSNIGCALIRFFTFLPIIVICVLFNKPDDYIPLFTALLPLLSINVMAFALEQQPPVQMVSNTDLTANNEVESEF